MHGKATMIWSREMNDKQQEIKQGEGIFINVIKNIRQKKVCMLRLYMSGWTVIKGRISFVLGALT